MHLRIALPLVLLFLTATPAAAGEAAHEIASRACNALQERANAVPGDGPLFLRSYDAASGEGPGSEPALNGAFTYDNALASIALVACGDTRAAQRVGQALLAAAAADRSGESGRLRNAYRPGPVEQSPVPPPVPPMGWWSDVERRWDEDPYQTGTATGNVAWAALALLTLEQATHDPRYRQGAARLARWTLAGFVDDRRPAGIVGGLYGYDVAPQRLAWKSTEQNTDWAAVFDWLARLEPDAGWQQPAQRARGFVASQWESDAGRFLVGTLPDGTTPNHVNSGLDAALWPLLLRDAPAEWRDSMSDVARRYAVGAGFDFNDDRDGIWWEGTAQAALVYRVLGRIEDAGRLLAALAGQFSPGGLVWATDRPRITTGLALSPQSMRDDFYYFHLPHLGATAWTALAALGWNPFTGSASKP